ncbi:hypothetical protein TNCV_234191 [Trichonephila clavipes]|uniref:Uncharacterized protein n=1 Tax=Trichonephila clavipes TaxID=2585209 RepID=A0A8X6VJ96_TRICX|nr:hypothetical protein TNCV_234191 [Trichonephila clavipes]
MRSACDQSTLPIDVQVFHCKARDPHVEAWRVGCHLSRPPRHSTEVPNHSVYERRVHVDATAKGAVWLTEFESFARVVYCDVFEHDEMSTLQDRNLPPVGENFVGGGDISTSN